MCIVHLSWRDNHYHESNEMEEGHDIAKRLPSEAHVGSWSLTCRCIYAKQTGRSADTVAETGVVQHLAVSLGTF